ncbi:hypothetical protein IFR05_013269 [Cadophora sp. M221]|nr:hypothetical protein IFR05_013269 [Cadophora sp. M221]
MVNTEPQSRGGLNLATPIQRTGDFSQLFVLSSFYQCLYVSSQLSNFGLLNLGAAGTPACIVCDDLQVSPPKTPSFSLKDVFISAKQGCSSCTVLQNSYFHIKERSHENIPEQLSDINFQLPLLDAGFPMGLASSDDDGWYSWDEIFTEVSAAKSPWPVIGQASERKGSAFESIAVLKTWIETCRASHPQCSMQNPNLPTRVLDVDGDTISLYVSEHEKEPYAALSHCWGKRLVIQTHKSTFGDRILDIPWGSLSKTFQDAVTTTRLLGLKYLWIDSLCIIQDDAEDWARESGSMASIYDGAQIVIAVSDSSNGYEGFLKDRPSTAGSKTIFQGINADGESYRIKVRQGDDHRWYGNLLPPRSQVFRSQELVWECRTSLWCECGTLSRPSQQRVPASKKTFYKSLRSQDHQALYSLWSRIVNTYASKALTNGGDILPALSGLAKRFQEFGAGDYLAGLWREDLPLSLLWEAHGTRASPYRAPSWSWASIDTSTTGSSLIAESSSDSKASVRTDILATVNIVFCESDMADPTGRVATGHLIITGQTVDIIALPRELINGYQSPFDWDARLPCVRSYLSQARFTDPESSNSLEGRVDEVNPGDSDEVSIFIKPTSQHDTALENPTTSKKPRRAHKLLGLERNPTSKVSLYSQPVLGTGTEIVEILQDNAKSRDLSIPTSNSILLSKSMASMIAECPSNEVPQRKSSSIETPLDFVGMESTQPAVESHPMWQDIRRRHDSLDFEDFSTFNFGFHADTVIPNLHQDKLICVLIAETVGAPRALVLRKVSGSDSDGLLYERVGLIDRIILGSGVRSNGWMGIFRDSRTRTVTII